MDAWRSTVSEKYAVFLEKFSEPTYRNILVISRFISEVENGGILQYLDNNSGDDFSYLVLAADEIDCPVLKSITKNISAMFPRGVVPKGRVERGVGIDQIMDSLGGEDPFDELTNEFEVGASCIESCLDRYLVSKGII